MKNLNLILVVSFLTFSCSSLQDAGSVLRNEKVKTTDEFLVKKKEPLVLPPNYEKIPEPGSINQKKTMRKKKKRKKFSKSLIKKNIKLKNLVQKTMNCTDR